MSFLNSHTEGGELRKTPGLVISALFYGIHNYLTQTVKGNVSKSFGKLLDSFIFRLVSFPPLWIPNFKIATFPHFPQVCKTLFSPQLKARETQVIQETKGEKFGNLVAYSILSQRHLRQSVTLLQDCHRLKNLALKSQKEGTGLEHLVVEVKFSFFFIILNALVWFRTSSVLLQNFRNSQELWLFREMFLEMKLTPD